MSKRAVAVCWGLCLVFLFAANNSYSMPNFARKYEKNCGMCHTQIPKLNQTGYEFRLAGYRLPDEIGQKEEDFDLGDFFAARFQTQFTYTKHDDVTPGEDTTNNQLEFKEFTFYPLTGSWGGNYASLGEFSMSPDDVFETENAFIRAVYGDENGWYQGRVGIMHPWEGWGASDRPLGLSRPLFQKQKSKGSPFILWNLDEAAIEGGYHSTAWGTSISARVSNGIIWKEDGSGSAEPAQGGNLTKPSGVPAQKDKSYQLFVNQILNKDSGVSLYYYHGAVPFPDPNSDPAPASLTKDIFDRYALYANWFAVPKVLNLLAGYGGGHDDLDDPSVAGGSSVGDVSGWYGEVNYHITEHTLAVGARYDVFDPSNDVSHNDQNAISVFANYVPIWHLQFVGEYSHKKTEQTSGGENTDDQLAVNFIFIF